MDHCSLEVDASLQGSKEKMRSLFIVAPRRINQGADPFALQSPSLEDSASGNSCSEATTSRCLWEEVNKRANSFQQQGCAQNKGLLFHGGFWKCITLTHTVTARPIEPSYMLYQWFSVRGLGTPGGLQNTPWESVAPFPARDSLILLFVQCLLAGEKPVKEFLDSK